MRWDSASVSTPVSTQPNRPAGGVAKLQPWASASLTLRERGQVQPGADALGMAAQLTLVDAPGQRLFQQGGCGQRGQQLGVHKGLHQIGWRSQKTHAPARRQNLGKATDVDGALQAVQRAQARGVVGRNVAVGVVFDDVKVVGIGQLQHAVGAARRQAVAGGVVEHAHTHKQLGGVQFAVACHHVQVRPVGAARHWQDAHAQCGEARKLDGPAGFLDHHIVTGAQQRAAHDVQRMGGPHGGHDLRGRRLHVVGSQLVRQGLAQASVARWLAVLQRKRLQHAAAGDLAHRSGHEGGFQPVRRKHPHARLRLLRAAVEHAAYQRRGIDRHMLRLKSAPQCRICY